MDGLNVPSNPSMQESEEGHDKSRSEDQASSDLKDNIQLWDFLGPRQRTLTEKGLGQRINWLEHQRIMQSKQYQRKGLRCLTSW